MRANLLSSLLLLCSLLQPPFEVNAAPFDKSSAAHRSVFANTNSLASFKNINETKANKEFLVKQAVSQRGGGGSVALPVDAISGALAMTLIERIVNNLFISNSITFPAPLAGCIGLFFAMLLGDVISPGLGDSIFAALTPGSNLLSEWFPVLFVPGLVLLPLAPSIGNGLDVFKFLIVTVIGFFYSIGTTAYSVLFLRAAQGTLVNKPPPAPKKYSRGKNTVAPRPFDEATVSFLVKASVVSGVISILATRMDSSWSQALRTIFFFSTTFASFVWGARLPESFCKVVHPLISSTVVTMAVLYLTALATGVDDWTDMLRMYKVGTYDLNKLGAADIMTFLLGPSVVSFATSMYSRRQLLKDNILVVLVAMLVSSVGGLFGTAFFVRLIQLGGPAGLLVRLSTLSRNVTTALAMPCTAILEGDISLAVLIVVLTGVFGATYGRRVLDFMGIYDPVTRGLAVGGAAQGLGVSSMTPEADAFPFAAISMMLTAIGATVLVSIPAVKDSLVSICRG